MNYQSNISMLKRRRYEERRLRKFPTGMRLEDAKNHSPLPSPLKVPFQCCESVSMSTFSIAFLLNDSICFAKRANGDGIIQCINRLCHSSLESH